MTIDKYKKFVLEEFRCNGRQVMDFWYSFKNTKAACDAMCALMAYEDYITYLRIIRQRKQK